MHQLIVRHFLAALDNAALRQGDDAAALSLPGVAPGRLAVSTDAHVVAPLFFPGGDIGRLAVCGTVNDVSMLGAEPLWLTAAFILEEGLEVDVLDRVVASMAVAAAEAEVHVVAGDTKVVERGRADGLYIATSGIGRLLEGPRISGANARPGDVVLVSGPVGDHGIAVLAARGGMGFETTVESDVAPLGHMVRALLRAAVSGVHVLRDPTRGGLGTTLCEIAGQSEVAVVVDESAVPVRPAVAAACEMLGLDPLYVACEGRLVAVIDPAGADAALAAMRATPHGRDAAVLGRVEAAPAGRVLMRTAVGGTRVIDMPSGELLPRIC
jgi:hydrogenase expression/formation protein HypE